MNPFLLPACTFGMHRRDRKTVHRDGPLFHAVCAGCGTPMVRNFNGWNVERKSRER